MDGWTGEQRGRWGGWGVGGCWGGVSGGVEVGGWGEWWGSRGLGEVGVRGWGGGWGCRGGWEVVGVGERGAEWRVGEWGNGEKLPRR